MASYRVVPDAGGPRLPADRKPDPPIRVLVVDGHPFSRSATGDFLRGLGFRIVAEEEDERRAVASLRRLHPDVALIDVDGLETPGPEAVRLVASVCRDARVVALSTVADLQAVIGTLAAGAWAYVLRQRPTAEMVAAVRAAARGESLLSPPITSDLVRWLREQAARPSGRPELTPRERDVLDLLVRGRDNAQIAATLFVSRATVKHHISSILTKLGVDNRTQAAVRAVSQGLLDRHP